MKTEIRGQSIIIFYGAHLLDFWLNFIKLNVRTIPLSIPCPMVEFACLCSELFRNDSLHHVSFLSIFPQFLIRFFKTLHANYSFLQALFNGDFCDLRVKSQNCLDRTAFRRRQLFAMKTLRKMIEHRISIKYCATLPNSILKTYISKLSFFNGFEHRRAYSTIGLGLESSIIFMLSHRKLRKKSRRYTQYKLMINIK